MKNLFKNLMLVAVAAMAFTACSEDNNEVNKAEKKVVYEFVASLEDDTRSGFTGSDVNEDGTTVYHSAWDGTETLYIVPDVGSPVEAPVTAEGRFTVELDPNASFVTVYSPKAAYEASVNYPVLPTEQTPLENSVDPAAHIVYSYGESVNSTEIKMHHQFAYGKMTVNVPAEFEIDYVELELNGDYFGYYDVAETLVLNADNVENNVFWFTSPIMTVKEFTLTAYDAEGNALTKTVNMAEKEKALAFSFGQVSKFSVSELEAAETPVAPVFSSAYISGYSYSDFNLYFEDETNALATLKLNAGGICSADWIMSEGEYQIGQYPGFFEGVSYGYSSYGGVGLKSGTVKISITDKKYHFEFINLTDGSDTVILDRAVFIGSIDGLNVPDPRTSLDTPSVKASVAGKVITISWTAVTGADSYNVFCASTSAIEPIDTTDTTVEIEAPAYSTAYEFMVTAVALDSNPDYKSSEPEYVTVVTERDPNAEVIEFTSLRFVRSETTYDPEYCNVFELTNADNVKMELYVGSYQSSETDIAVGSYHYESKDNLGWSQRQWGFQSKIWVGDEYLGLAGQNSIMVVNKSGDVYNIDFTLVIEGVTHFFSCNAPIGGDDNTGEGGDDNTGEGGDDNTGEGGDDNTDVVPDGFTKVDFVSATQGSFGGRQYNWMGDFKFSYMGEEVSFSMCDYNGPMQMLNKDIKPGTYVNNGNGANMDTKELYNISVAGMSGMSGSQVEVSKDGNVYTFLMTITANNIPFKFYYKGEI